jgi:flagellar basal-body rod modification protein FlgD
MSSVPPVSNSGSSSPTPPASNSAAASATVNFDQFLTILVTELQNQDPTSPTDPTQYMSQLASFSAVGQQIQTNTTLGTMLASQTLTQAEQMIGQRVTSADGKTSGTVASVSLTSGGVIAATLDDGTQVALTTGSTVDTNTTLSDGSLFQLPAGVIFGAPPSSSNSSASNSSSNSSS